MALRPQLAWRILNDLTVGSFALKSESLNLESPRLRGDEDNPLKRFSSARSSFSPLTAGRNSDQSIWSGAAVLPVHSPVHTRSLASVGYAPVSCRVQLPACHQWPLRTRKPFLCCTR